MVPVDDVLPEPGLGKLSPVVVVTVAEPPTNDCKFRISVTERKLSERLSLEASEIDKGDVWSSESAPSDRIKRYVKFLHYRNMQFTSPIRIG